LRAEIILFHM